MYRNLISVCSVFALSGCMAQSNIQSKYMSQQDECRGHTQSIMGIFTGADNTLGSGQPPVGSGPTVQKFSECMNKSGWHVSTPKTGGTPPVVAQNPPTGSPSTNPSAATAVAAPPQTASAQPAQTAIVSPPSGAPSTNPSAAAARVVTPVDQPPVATYQPARPVSTPPVSYGQGAGRQF